MTSAQLEKRLIEYTRGLPLETLQEILDFIKFIKQKGTRKNNLDLTESLSQLDYSQTTHLEKEFKDYRKLYGKEDVC